MDSIIEEVRRNRDAFAQEFGYDLQAIHRNLKELEKASGRKLVKLPPRRPQLVGQPQKDRDA
jgi:hypothetical protein